MPPITLSEDFVDVKQGGVRSFLDALYALYGSQSYLSQCFVFSGSNLAASTLLIFYNHQPSIFFKYVSISLSNLWNLEHVTGTFIMQKCIHVNQNKGIIGVNNLFKSNAFIKNNMRSHNKENNINMKFTFIKVLCSIV